MWFMSACRQLSSHVTAGFEVVPCRRQALRCACVHEWMMWLISVGRQESRHIEAVEDGSCLRKGNGAGMWQH
jgi:hypothetical protein